MPSPSTRGQHRSNNAPSNSSALTPNVASNASLACCNVTRDQWLIVLQRWKFSLDREIDAMTQEISDSINGQSRAAGVDLNNWKPPRAVVESMVRLRSLGARYRATKKGG